MACSARGSRTALLRRKGSRTFAPAERSDRSAIGPTPEGAGLSSIPVSSRITAADVAKVARLARLELDDGDLQRATEQLDGMLEHFADIDALDLDAVEPMTQPYPLVNVLRADTERPCLDRDEVLAAAPSAEDGRFRVPPIVGLDS